MRKEINPELRARVVRLRGHHAQESTSMTEPAEAATNQLGVGRETVRRWSMQADVDAWSPKGVSSEELAEIGKLKAENRQLREDVAILKATTTFSATELDRRNR